MKIRLAIFSAVVALAAFTFSGCGSAHDVSSYRHIEGFAQGTTYSIVYSDTTDHSARIEQFLVDFDSSLSIFDSTSLVSRLNEGLTDTVDAWYTECFEISQSVYKLSGGLFDPTLRPLIAAYGFARKNEQKEIDSVEFAAIMSTVGFDKVEIEGGRLVRQNPDTELDFNAIAQGYSVDLVGRIFDDLGIKNYMIEIGGEIITRGVAPSGEAWRIGIDSPEEGNFTPGATISTVVELQNRGLATSGNYRKFIDTPSGDRLSHTIDPRTGRSSRHNLLSATILAPSAALADALATACMVGGLEWAKKMIADNIDVDGYLIYADQNGAMKSYSTIPSAD